LSDVVGAPSTGRTTIIVRALAAATADRGEAAALVDACDAFDAAAADAHGVHLPRLLWVRGDGDAPRALKAFSLILQAGGFGLVVLDLADVPSAALRRFPWTTWMRLARIIEHSETAAVVVGAERLARSAGGATVALEGAGVEWRGDAHRARLLTGVNPTPRVIGVR
jgi:recA bacterial DNA recombination protein